MPCCCRVFHFQRPWTTTTTSSNNSYPQSVSVSILLKLFTEHHSHRQTSISRSADTISRTRTHTQTHCSIYIDRLVFIDVLKSCVGWSVVIKWCNDKIYTLELLTKRLDRHKRFERWMVHNGVHQRKNSDDSDRRPLVRRTKRHKHVVPCLWRSNTWFILIIESH